MGNKANKHIAYMAAAAEALKGDDGGEACRRAAQSVCHLATCVTSEPQQTLPALKIPTTTTATSNKLIIIIIIVIVIVIVIFAQPLLTAIVGRQQGAALAAVCCLMAVERHLSLVL